MGWNGIHASAVRKQEESDDQHGGHGEGEREVLLHLAALGDAEPAADAADAVGQAVHHAVDDLVVEQRRQRGRSASAGSSPASAVEFAHDGVDRLDRLARQPQEGAPALAVEPVHVQADRRLGHQFLEQQEEAQRR